ncbi:hypothetical protein INT45_004522 [Circinella minor]|uniref:C2H2-type domain-containing protein n=1 Tax=Circinella minor TaxID=1195481 RepID=A0A8H7VM55_9FUNG|nr:hypothetical protein INT45_004522 [Circinella minor]
MTSSTVNENMNSNYFNQDFCLNDSLVGSQQLNNAQSFTIPAAVQVQTEEEYPFFSTPVPTVPASPSSSISSFIKYEQDFTFMTSSPSPDSMMIHHQHQHYEQQQQYNPTTTTTTTTTERRTSTRRRTPKIHQCPHCPHTSNRANNMKEHILTHDPNRPKKFPCPKCGKRFARKHDMRRHSKSPHH